MNITRTQLWVNETYDLLSDGIPKLGMVFLTGRWFGRDVSYLLMQKGVESGSKIGANGFTLDPVHRFVVFALSNAFFLICYSPSSPLKFLALTFAASEATYRIGKFALDKLGLSPRELLAKATGGFILPRERYSEWLEIALKNKEYTWVKLYGLETSRFEQSLEGDQKTRIDQELAKILTNEQLKLRENTSDLQFSQETRTQFKESFLKSLSRLQMWQIDEMLEKIPLSSRQKRLIELSFFDELSVEKVGLFMKLLSSTLKESQIKLLSETDRERVERELKILNSDVLHDEQQEALADALIRIFDADQMEGYLFGEQFPYLLDEQVKAIFTLLKGILRKEQFTRLELTTAEQMRMALEKMKEEAFLNTLIFETDREKVTRMLKLANNEILFDDQREALASAIVRILDTYQVDEYLSNERFPHLSDQQIREFESFFNGLLRKEQLSQFELTAEKKASVLLKKMEEGAFLYTLVAETSQEKVERVLSVLEKDILNNFQRNFLSNALVQIVDADQIQEYLFFERFPDLREEQINAIFALIAKILGKKQHELLEMTPDERMRLTLRRMKRESFLYTLAGVRQTEPNLDFKSIFSEADYENLSEYFEGKLTLEDLEE